MYNIEVKE